MSALQKVGVVCVCIFLIACVGQTIYADEEETVEHHAYSIMTKTRGEKATQDVLDVWICDRSSFYVSTHRVNFDLQKLAYYDGKSLVTGFRRAEQAFGFVAYEVVKIPKQQNPDHICFYFSTLVVPCVYHPKTKTKMFCYDFDLEKVLKVKRVADDPKMIKYKSETQTLWFDKQSGLLKHYHFVDQGWDVTVIHEGTVDVTGYNRRIIQRNAKEGLSLRFTNGVLNDEFEHKDNLLIEFANQLYK